MAGGCLLRWLTWGLAVFTLTAAFALTAVWALPWYMGFTPGRMLDYAERRLDGHPKLEAVALPAMGVARDLLDEPSRKDRLAEPFVAPPPPPPWPATQEKPITPDAGAGGRVLRVGPTEAIRTIAEASRLARDGDTVEIMAGTYRGDVALWLQKRLTIRGVGGQARLIADGRSIEGKAIWVVRNGHFEIENIDFIGVRVADRNGAGIRFENGHLVVRNCLFWDSESGILTSEGPAVRQASMEIEGSEFGYLGDGEGQSHGIYAGRIALLRVMGSYFHHGNVGHLIKSRAAVSDIRYNRLTDESGGRASYEIDLPNGGLAVVLGNVVQQGRRTENSALISFGQEGYRWPRNRLYLMSNTLVNDHPLGGAMLRTKPGADSVVALNNVRSGAVRYHADDALTPNNNLTGDWSLFHFAARHDYRLAPAGRRQLYQRPLLDEVEGLGLVPQAEYLHPRQLQVLRAPPTLPGALQSLP